MKKKHRVNMRSAALGHESAAADNQGISKRFACACQCPLDGGETDDDTFRLKKTQSLTYSTRCVFQFPRCFVWTEVEEHGY